jgi:hypothetical protein
MISAFLCGFAFFVAFWAGRRSLVAGLVTVLTIGYMYGVVRANVAGAAAHLLFDAAVLGFYLARLGFGWTAAQRAAVSPLARWVAVLMAWPLLLALVPSQDPLIQLVGLRGNALLLPFLVVGGRLDHAERQYLALCMAGLNVTAFAIAIAQYAVGLEFFFPENEVTALIYSSRDVAGDVAFRIPASFVNAHAYGGTMVMTLPFLAGAWMQSHWRRWQRHVLTLALVASLLAVFMAGARIPTVVAFTLIGVVAISRLSRWVQRLGWVAVVGPVAWIVSREERLQRFLTLLETEAVAERISGSVNMNFVDIVVDYPLGNGLGGGGTSIPYFLHDRVRYPVLLENEYARIVLEEGLLGLGLWLVFLTWAFSRGRIEENSGWRLGQRLAWTGALSYFAAGLIGIGLLTSIPQTCLLLMNIGWVASRNVGASEIKIG